MNRRSKPVLVLPALTAALAATLATVALVPAALAGQELRGRVVVEGGVDQPIEGAVVTLLDTADQTVDAAFTSPSGTFAVQADSAGDYRVRVDRIGYARWHSEVYHLDAAAPTIVELSIPVEPVRLADLDVEVYRGCEANPTRARAIEVVWDEARKALEAALLAEELQLFRYGSVIFDRDVTSGRLFVIGVETTAVSGVSRAPFRSLSAEDLSDEGYIQEEGSTVFFYAPDATVLLSDQFLSEHCFGLDRDEVEGRSVVGLRFEPRDDRDLPDISGVLWLDEDSGALDRVEFRYENIPYRGVDDRRIAGTVVYGRLPTGAFIVRDWYIRMPALLKEDDRDRYYVDHFTEYGAELRDVSTPDGEPVEWREGAGIHGHIVNSLTGEPLKDATMILDRPRGEDLIRQTGPNGEYYYDRLDPGTYSIGFLHPVLTSIDWDPPVAEVTLAADERREVDFALPPPDRLLEDLCGADVVRTTAFVGRVREAETGFPIDRARVWATWTEVLSGAEPGGASGRQTVTSEVARTDRNGRYVLCDLPRGQNLVVQVDASRGRTAARALRTAYLVNVADFHLDPLP